MWRERESKALAVLRDSSATLGSVAVGGGMVWAGGRMTGTC